MKLTCIDDILQGMSVFMPSGLIAELFINDEGNIEVLYANKKDTYSQDEFGNIIKDGIELLNEPSQLVIESYKKKSKSYLTEKLYKVNIKNDKRPEFIEAETEQEVKDRLEKYNLEYDSIEEMPEDHEEVTEKYWMIHRSGDGPDAAGEVTFVPTYFGYDYVTGDKDLDDYDNKPKWTTIRTIEGIRNWFRNVLFQYGAKEVGIGEHTWNIDDFKESFNENKLVAMDRLEHVARKCKNPEIRQKALTLLDNIGLGLDVRKEVEDLFKLVDKEHKKHKPLDEKVSGYEKIGDTRKTKNYTRTRLAQPTSCKPNSFRTKDVNDAGDKVVLCQDKKTNKWKAQSKLKKNENKEIFMNTREMIKALNEAIAFSLDEISDETVKNAYIKRLRNVDDAEGAVIKSTDKFLKTKDAEAAEQAKKELDANKTKWAQAHNKAERNAKLTLGHKFKKDEAFEDEMLTDINDLDFPTAFEDTVETDEEGELLTLGKLADKINSLEDTIKDEIEDLKDDLKDEIKEIKPEETEEVEFEDEEPESENEEDIEEDTEEDSEEDSDNEEPLEDQLEEALQSYLKKGCLEDLQKTKQEVDKLEREGKSAEEIKNTITMMSDDDKEKEEAEKYAIEKMKESLLDSSKTSKLSKLLK